VAIMYAGKIVELASATDIFNRPLHPYTEGLMSSIPGEGKPGDKLETIKGIVPNLIAPPPGCRFHPRCPIAEPVCSRKSPTLTEDQTGHSVACHLR
jgi:peptide/nickel transport system ATP-binding protein